MALFRIARPFVYSLDGITPMQADPGALLAIPDALAPGLLAEGFIRHDRREAKPGAPLETQAMAAAPEAKGGDMAALRAEYQGAFGKRPFMGWDADALRTKIAEARG